MGGKPKPFSRPSVNLGGSAASKKEWQHVLPEKVNVGDIVADLGLITTTESGTFHVILTNVNGDQLYAPFDNTVFAFTSIQ